MKLKPYVVVISLLTALIVIVVNGLKREATESRVDLFSLSIEDNTDRILLYKKGLPAGGFVKDADGNWKLNKTKVDKQMADLLIQVLKSIEIKAEVPLKKQAQIRQQLKKDGIIVEYYNKKYLAKSYYLCSDKAGKKNYAMIEGEDVPFIIGIPRSPKNLTGLFSIPEVDWQERTLFENSFDGIQKVKVQYFNSQEDSFEIEKNGKRLYVNGISRIDEGKVKSFLSSFQLVKAGAHISTNEILKDSLRISKPFCQISLQDIDALKNRQLKVYKDEQNKNIVYGQIAGKEEVFMIPVQNLEFIIAAKKSHFKQNS